MYQKGWGRVLLHCLSGSTPLFLIPVVLFYMGELLKPSPFGDQIPWRSLVVGVLKPN